MAFLLSKQSILYLLDELYKQSLSREESFPASINEKDIDKIYSIIKNASQSVFGIKRNPSFIEQIAYITFQINKQHILADGNKRLSLLITLYLCEKNKIHHEKMSQSDWEMYIMRIAADSQFTQEQATEYLIEKLV